MGLTPEKFNQACGDLTVDQKIDVINQLAADQDKNFELVRWRTWVNQDSSKQIAQMIPLYDSVEGLKDSITSTANDFARRHRDSDDDTSEKLWKHRAKAYLTEECPSVMWLAASLGYNFVIYPGEIIPSFRTTRDFFVVEEHKARIENGLNIKEDCAHSEFCIHVKDPRRLVNWLEVHFRKIRPTPLKAPEMGGFERGSEPEHTTTSPMSTQAPSARIGILGGGPLTFFSPSPDNAPTSNDNTKESTLKSEDEFLLERTGNDQNPTDDERISNEQKC
ncbi:hypothetical protein [Legionella tunisiensis]|uniref:hypothetical protein n=1 Tax=Legionella tunisiensis TaxID=1034944 RepID=UPI000305C8BA|nr:hypothetical protein [Legionella tunisiensis]